jgi:Uma2 family endonuclease
MGVRWGFLAIAIVGAGQREENGFMAQITEPSSGTRKKTFRTLASLFRRLGPIPPSRIRLSPAPGSAEERHVLEIAAREDRLCELVDGVLIEKDMASFESQLAMLIGHFLLTFLEKHDLGVILGPDGMLRLAPGLVRIPDVSFIAWAQLPGRALPDSPIASLYPDLAVEVLSPGNSPGEMRRKLRDYFNAGTKLVWLIDSKTRTAEAYTSVRRREFLGETGSLSGGKLLPGFELSLEQLFARARR